MTNFNVSIEWPKYFVSFTSPWPEVETSGFLLSKEVLAEQVLSNEKCVKIDPDCA